MQIRMQLKHIVKELYRNNKNAADSAAFEKCLILHVGTKSDCTDHHDIS